MSAYIGRRDPAQRQKDAARLARRRDDERNDALHFLYHGHDAHAGVCLFRREGGEPCSRDYDPMPHFEAALTEPRFYDGSGIGALYGLPGSERLCASLAGWNVRRREEFA